MIRRSVLLAGVTAVLLSASGAVALAADAIPAGIRAAVDNPARPAADRQRDANRKPAELLVFSGLKPGDRAIDLLPGGGYFTRLFSRVVGERGVVYAAAPPRPASAPATAPDFAAAVKAIAADPQFANVRVITMDAPGLAGVEKADLAWTSLNYHDMHNRPNADLGAFNKMVFDALKPGGTFIVIDHAAEKGAGKRDTQTLHRIDADLVKTEVTGAGFVLEAESAVLRNPEDPHNVAVREGSVAGHTDQFVLRFRKPR
jgi:predicted methyltransferase